MDNFRYESVFVIIAFRSEFITLPDADKKPLGTDAALFLSQLVWLSGNCADEKGWFMWTQAKCTEDTGLTRFQQEQIRQRLTKAGYIKEDRRGIDGRLHYSVCKFLANLNEKGMQETDIPNSEFREGNARNSQTEEGSECKKLANRNARNSQTEPDFVSTKETKNRGDIYPPISPHKLGSRKAFVPPSEEECLEFMKTEGGGADDAADFFDHFNSNGWLVSGKTPMSDWRSAARKWLRTGRKWAAENAARGSPTNGIKPPPKTSAEKDAEEWAALERIAAKGGFDFGR